MVKKRKFSHKKLRIVKGGFTRFLHEGQKESEEDSSLPQSGQFFIILLCNTSDLINDFMKNLNFYIGFLLRRDTLHCQRCLIQGYEAFTGDDQ